MEYLCRMAYEGLPENFKKRRKRCIPQIEKDMQDATKALESSLIERVYNQHTISGCSDISRTYGIAIDQPSSEQAWAYILYTLIGVYGSIEHGRGSH